MSKEFDHNPLVLHQPFPVYIMASPVHGPKEEYFTTYHIFWCRSVCKMDSLHCTQAEHSDTVVAVFGFPNDILPRLPSYLV